MKIVFVLLFFLLCTVGWTGEIPKTEDNLCPPDLKEIEVSGPYCGIYALIACLDTFGIRPHFEEFFVAEFVGSFQGSSDSELRKAAQTYGLYGKTYSGLTWQEIKASKSPMILHFRSTYADSKFNHWVAYLGVDGGKARIIDIPHRIATIPFSEILAKWDGTAIVISKEPIQGDFIATARWNYLSMILLLLGILVAARAFFWDHDNENFLALTFFQKIKLAIIQTSALLGVLFVVGILYHALSPIGFLRNPSAVAEVTRRYYSIDVPEIDITETERAIESKTIQLYDARYSRDYVRGTIPSAKNLSINSSLTERQQMLGATPKSQRIVVFCQSSGCGYADEVAQFLKFYGYENVVIFRGGYREWSKKHDAKQ